MMTSWDYRLEKWSTATGGEKWNCATELCNGKCNPERGKWISATNAHHDGTLRHSEQPRKNANVSKNTQCHAAHYNGTPRRKNNGNVSKHTQCHAAHYDGTPHRKKCKCKQKYTNYHHVMHHIMMGHNFGNILKDIINQI